MRDQSTNTLDNGPFSPGWRRVQLGSMLVAGSLLCAGIAHSQLAAPQPGVIQDIAGHVPDQAEQARMTPIRETSSGGPARDWKEPGQGGMFPEEASYDNDLGAMGIFVDGGPVNMKGHPFFTPLGENGRACVTCHQPADSMSISAETVRRRWAETKGKDPLFAAIDGSNCPNLPQDKKESHSLLLERGLFRIFLPWPAKAADGSPIKPEFTLEVVSDPTGCNTDPKYGLNSANPMVSIYRRPRVVANMKYVMKPYAQYFNIKLGTPLEKDPETGERVGMNLMSDSRQPTLRSQSVEAAITHLQFSGKLAPDQQKQIEAFERSIYVGQVKGKGGVALTTTAGVEGLGPRAMFQQKPGLGDVFADPVFKKFDAWKTPDPRLNAQQNAFRASVARGADVFFVRTFWINNVNYINSIGLGNPIKRSCATCHNAAMTGMDVAPGWLDLGTSNRPTALVQPDLPLFKITCSPSAKPHPYLGRTIYTQDPGRALISGRCADVGAITMQQMRGLAGRAPYFANGGANSLDELVNYYDRRFNMQLTDQERRDLVNFLGVL